MALLLLKNMHYRLFMEVSDAWFSIGLKTLHHYDQNGLRYSSLFYFHAQSINKKQLPTSAVIFATNENTWQ